MSTGWQPQKRAAALILAANGWRVSAIAEAVGAARTTVSKWLRRPPPVLKDETRQRRLVRRLRRAGWTRAEIGAASQLSEGQIRRLEGNRRPTSKSEEVPRAGA